jgi:Kef-type K+ transport system membrane component KefB
MTQRRYFNSGPILMRVLCFLGVLVISCCPGLCSSAPPDLTAAPAVTDPMIATFMLQFIIIGVGLAFVIPLCRRLNIEEFVGETALGILLGPSVFGALAPRLHDSIFPRAPQFMVPLILFGMIGLLFSFVKVGSEIRPAEAIKNGKDAAWLGIGGLIIPAVLCYGLALAFCKLTGTTSPGGQSVHLLAIFLAITMAISAMVIAIRLFNALKINETDIGKTMLCGYALNSILAWMAYGFLFQTARGEKNDAVHTAICLLVGTLLTFYCLRFAPRQAEQFFKHLAKQRREANTYWWLILIAFGLGALTYLIGFTQYYGVFLGGIVVSSSRHISEEVRLRLTTLTEYVMTPVFFVTIGLYTDFRTDFSLVTVLFITVVSIALKYYGARWSAVLAGRPKSELNGIGWSFVPGGVDGIVFGTVALQIGLINTRLMGGIIVSAIASTVIVGPLLKRAVLLTNRQRPKKPLLEHTAGKLQRLPRCDATDREGALTLILPHIAAVTRLRAEEIKQLLDDMLADNRYETRNENEGILFPERIAYLHCSLPGLKEETLFIFWSGSDIDWNGAPVRLVVFLASPVGFPDLSFQARTTRLMLKLDAAALKLDASDDSRRAVWTMIRPLLSQL